MIAQLALHVGDRPVPAAIETIVLRDLDHLRYGSPWPEDDENRRAAAHLIRGAELLLDWLAAQTELPIDPLAWPCSACLAAPGDPCDVVDRRDKWIPDGPRYHLDRGLTGRWFDTAERAA